MLPIPNVLYEMLLILSQAVVSWILISQAVVSWILFSHFYLLKSTFRIVTAFFS